MRKAFFLCRNIGFCHSGPTPCPAYEVDSPVEAGEMSTQLTKGGRPRRGGLKNQNEKGAQTPTKGVFLFLSSSACRRIRVRVPHGDVSTALRSAQHDRKNTFLFLNSYVFVILILPLALAHEESQKHMRGLKKLFLFSPHLSQILPGSVRRVGSE